MIRILRAAKALGEGAELLEEGDAEAAIDHFRRGLSLVNAGSTRYYLNLGLAEAYQELGDVEQAVETLTAIATTAHQDEGNPFTLRRTYRMGTDVVPASTARIEALEEIAALHERSESHREHAEALGLLADAARASDPRLRSRSLREKARAHRAAGDLAEALRAGDQAVDEAASQSRVVDEAESRLIRSFVHWVAGDREAAREDLAHAERGFEKAADIAGQARAAGQAGIFCFDDDELASARTHFERSLELATAAEADRYIEAAEQAIRKVDNRLERPEGAP